MIEFPITLTSGGSVCLPGHTFALALGYTKNRGVYRLAVTASGEWEGLTIRAFWHVPDGKDPASSLVDGYVGVPASVTSQPGSGCITFEGSDGTKTVTSADLRYRVSANSGTEDGTMPEPGTPAWQQLVDSVHTVATAAEQAKTDAQTAAQQAGQALSDTIAAKDGALKAISDKQTSATTAVESAQGKALDAVDTARDKVLQQVESSTKAAQTAASEATGRLQELKDSIANGNFKGEKGDPGPAVALDTTLTHEGEAADAKATGDAISAVKVRQNVLTGSETGNPIAVDDAFPAPLCGLTVYGKSTQDGTPTPDAPVPIVSAGDGGSVAVKVTGKNLLNPALFQDNKYQNFDVSKKYYSISPNDSYWITGIQPCLPNTTYHCNKNMEGGCFYDKKKNVIGTVGFEFTIKTPVKCAYYCVNFSKSGVPYGTPVIATVSKPATYSPYREQLLTLPTPNGLPGIPVTSGGNYADPQGQQWVCDEVDLERGVKVQRVNRLKLDALSWRYELTPTNKSDTFISDVPASQDGTMRGHSLCQYAVFDGVAYDIEMKEACRCYVWVKSVTLQFKAGSGVNSVDAFSEWLKARPDASISYCLATPIETPLTPAEIAAYKALTAYGPDTVVQAGDGAGIRLGYQRDVNIAIKKLEDAVASMT